MIFFRSLLFNILFTAWALIASIIFAPLFLISREKSLGCGGPWARGALFLARWILGITYEIRGREHLTNEPVIYASKHQSAWDTCIFLTLLDKPCYVLKRELLRIPFWGWYLWRMGMIAIDRSGGASTIKLMIRDSKDRLSEGRTIVIYPEGTRTRPGAAPQYHPGVVALYSQLGVPVIPVALNSGLYWGKNAFMKKPGKIILTLLPPIPPGLPKAEFSTRLQENIETESNKLLSQQ
jgi:1-acyl-sn-glycerol-3-phosphate acyltransferase